MGTTIEFCDFYIYGAAAALVIGQTFFPQSAPGAQGLNAFPTFGIAFLARPVGSFFFGRFGDRVGRKAPLVATMLTMGLSATLIGVLPGYAQAGVLAPWLLERGGLAWVGYYIVAAAAISFLSLLGVKESARSAAGR